MKTYMVQVKVYGYTQVEADSWEDAEQKAEDLALQDFDMSFVSASVLRDCDIDVINEMDDAVLQDRRGQLFPRRLDAGEDKN